MKRRIKRTISIILVISMCIPLFWDGLGNTVYAASENQETYTTLSDGSEWILNTGSANTLSVLDDGSYQIKTTETSATTATSFSMMQNRAYPASTVHNLSVDYRVGGTSFGFSTTGSLEGTDPSGKGVVKFYREDAGSNITNLYLKLESGLIKVASFTATRATLAHITIVKADNGSYYLSFKGNVVNGSSYSEDVQEAVKLEKYFTKEYLEQDGLLYFFAMADGFNPSNPVRYFVSSTYGYPYTVSSLASTSDRNTPSTWSIVGKHAVSYGDVADNTYEFVAGTGGITKDLAIPVTSLGESEATPFITNFTYSVNLNSVFTSQDWHYIYFSSDPNFETYDRISVVRVERSAKPHVIFNGKTVTTFTNMLYNGADYGASYYWTFQVVEGTVQLKVQLGTTGVSGTFSGFTSVSANKPVYMKIAAPDVSKYSSSNVNLKYRVNIAETEARTAIATMESDIIAAKQEVDGGKNILNYADAIDAYKNFSMKKGLSYEALLAGSKLIWQYDDACSKGVEEFAQKVADLVASIPVEELEYQDIDTVYALRDEYDSMPDEMKAQLVDEAATLNAYVTKANTLEFEGSYRTTSGDRYKVMVDDVKDFIISSAPNGGISVTTADGGYNDSKYGVAVETEKYYPIIGTKFDVQCNFGTTQNNSVIELKCGEKKFSVVRQHSGMSSTISISVNGEAYTCLMVSGQLRTRVYTLGVTKSNGSWYLTYDGHIIDGSDCSAEVKNALKLENTFGTEFMEQNKGVQFCIWTDSLGEHPYLYMCPTTKVENGVLYQMSYAYGDRNLGASPCSAAEAVSVSTNDIVTETPSHVGEKTSVSFTFNRKGDSTIVSMPLDATKGWTTTSNMALYGSGLNQWVTYQLSNDPTFSDGTELSFKIILFAGGNTNVYYNKTEQGARFTNFFNGNEVAWSITSNNCLQIGDKEYAALDMSSYVGKPIYMKIITDIEDTFKPHSTTVTIPDADGVAYDWLTGNGADLPDKVGSMTNTELSTILNAYFTSGYRFSSSNLYKETTKAMELALAGASDVEAAHVVDAAIATVYPYTRDWYYHGDAIRVMDRKYKELTPTIQNSYVTHQQNLMAMNTYLSNLTAIEKDVTAKAMRKGLVRTETITTPEYDFYHDNALDVRDLVRIKKAENAQATNYVNENAIAMTLQASDYGAVGDGKHNDATAVDMAISLLSCYGPGSILNFDKEKTYYIGNVSEGSVFVLNNVKGLTIDGNGSSFIIGENGQYASVQNSKDCVIREATFDYETSPAFAATYSSGHQATAWSTKDYSAQFVVTTDIGLEVGQTYEAPSGFFGVIKHETERCHMYIKKYEMVSENKVKVYFDSNVAQTRAWYSNKAYQVGLILPTPNVGHAQERAFTIRGNDCFDMKDVTIRAAAKFGMFVADNEGEINFTNVDFAPENKDFYFTSWRDAYHCKDNRASIHWTDCDSHWNYDDVFNVSASKLHISEYDASALSMSMIWTENPTSNYYDMLVGDQIQVLDTKAGKDCGVVKVTEVVSQADGVIKVKIDKALSNDPTVGITLNAYVLQRCGAGSTITNGTYNGTFRFRAPMTITGTTFDACMRIWMGLESSLEGPLPKDILFQNCTFDFGTSGVVDVNASSDGTAKEYHVENIVFDSCSEITNSNITGTDKNYITIK